jgi:hypothetical protein
MKLLTFGDDPAKIKYLKEPYINVGLGRRFRDTFSKFEAVAEWGRTANPSEDELVCFVDGYDVIQFGDLDEIETKFKSFGDIDLVVSAEVFCWPSPWMAHLFPEVPTKYRFPNIGMYIGKWSALKKMLEWDTYRIAFDDQGYFHDFYLRQKLIKVVQDHDCILFQNCVFVPWTEFEWHQRRPVNLEKGTRPCFFHFSGKSDRIRDSDESVLDFLARAEPIAHLQPISRVVSGP